MRVTIAASSISRAGGGVTPAMRDLSAAVSSCECEVSVVSLEDPFSTDDSKRWPSNVPIQLCAVIGPRSFGFASMMFESVKQLRPDLLHRHGIWNYPSRVVSRYAKAYGTPYVVSIHGMLNRTALRVSRFRKLVFGSLVERRFLQNAGCIHALSEAEAYACRAYGLSNPIAVIPNGIDPLPTNASSADVPWPNPDDRRNVLLYVGRLHPIKGLPVLMHSFAQVKDPTWRLVVAGWEQLGHQAELKSLVSQLGINESVDFIGPIYDAAKEAALQRCEAFVLPSTSEAQPIAVLEAWARGVPAVITEACNLPEAARENMSIVTKGTEDSIARGLRELFGMSLDSRHKMGQRAKLYAESHFRWECQAQKMRSVYRWLVYGDPQPPCVVSAIARTP